MSQFTQYPVFPTVLALAVIASGCVVVHDGPPRHPEDGYIHHHDVVGVELVYVASLGVYRVAGYPGCYYHDGRFYRARSGAWEVTSDFKGGRWKKAHPHGMPPGLARRS